MRKKKSEKFGVHDINKSSSKDISHTINKIKENETKYTIILVIFFMTLFFVIGYVSLRVKTISILDYSSDFNSAYVSLSSSVITLDDNDIMSDSMGLASNGINLSFHNTVSKDLNYKLILVEDDDMKRICGCSSDLFNIENIRYSIDGKTVKGISKDSMLLTTGFLEMGKNDNINIKIWLADNSLNSGHFHGRIYFEKIEEN